MNKNCYVEKIWHACNPLSIAEIVKNFNTIVFTGGTGSIEPVLNAVNITELAVEKGAQVVLLPVSCRRQLFDLSDDMATKVDVQFYADARDAMLKALVE